MYVNSIVLIVSLLIVIAILFVIFLAIRNFICWYYKININIKLLESINNKLEFLSKQNFPDEYSEFEKSLCSKCGNKIEGVNYYCSNCDEHYCHDCILAGAKCPKCKSRLSN